MAVSDVIALAAAHTKSVQFASAFLSAATARLPAPTASSTCWLDVPCAQKPGIRIGKILHGVSRRHASPDFFEHEPGTSTFQSCNDLMPSGRSSRSATQFKAAAEGVCM